MGHFRLTSQRGDSSKRAQGGRTMRGDPIEAEIKLLADGDAAAALARHPAFAHTQSDERRERTTYFDTDDLSLRERGLSLRIRKSRDGFVQTLKRASKNGTSVGQRDEWEWPVHSEHVAIKPLDEIATRTGVHADAYAHVRPIFVTDIERRAFALTLDDGAEVEAVVDEGAVLADGREEWLSEVEIELKKGSMASAYRLALELSRTNGWRIGGENKVDRGYRLLLGRPARVEKSRAAPIPDGASVQEALAILTVAALDSFVTDSAAAEAGDGEAVHQMRVALRRLRTVFVLFGPLLEDDAKARFNMSIRKIGGVLGAARDWDVSALEIMDDAARDGVSEELLAPLRVKAAGKREAAHAAVARLLKGTQPTQLVLALEVWIAGGEWRREGADDTRSTRKALPHLLDRLLRKVRKRAEGMAERSTAELHPLRKSVKKLRFSAEACTALYGARKTGMWVKRCKKLQKILGGINDASMVAAMLDEFATADDLREALYAWRDARIAKARDKLVPAWHALEEEKPFWR